MSQAIQKASSDKRILKKHVSAIHIGAELTLLQRKLVNALLYQAYDNLLTEREHTIPSTILCEMIGFDSKNTAYLKAALKGLMETVVEFDLLDDNGKQVWEAMSLLPYARLKGGVCTYRFDEALSEKLYHPDTYSKINLSVLKEIKSSHALVLYENCHRFLNVGRTSWLDIDVFRKLMGIEGKYKEFKVLKRDVIIPAMKEVNRLSNIQIDMETRNKGRTVTGIQFLVKPNSQLSLIGMEDEDEITSNPLYQALRDNGIQKMLARSWIIDHEDEYLSDKLELTLDMVKQGKIKGSKAAFLRAAIEDDYHSEVSEKRRAKEQVEQNRLERAQLEARLTELRRQKKAIEQAYRQALVGQIETTFSALSMEEQEQIKQEFRDKLGSRIFVQAFDKQGWSDRLVYPYLIEFWEARNISLPSLGEAANSIGFDAIENIEKNISIIEAQIK